MQWWQRRLGEEGEDDSATDAPSPPRPLTALSGRELVAALSVDDTVADGADGSN